MKTLYDGSRHNYNMPTSELQTKLIDLTLKIYRALKKGEVVEVYLEGSTRKWELFNVGDEIFIDAIYRINK